MFRLIFFFFLVVLSLRTGVAVTNQRELEGAREAAQRAEHERAGAHAKMVQAVHRAQNMHAQLLERQLELEAWEKKQVRLFFLD
jgi:hypothetical protein